MHVPAEPIELGDDHRGLELPGVGQGGGQLGPPIERVVALARLDLAVPGAIS